MADQRAKHEKLLDLIELAYEIPDRSEMIAALVNGLRGLVPCASAITMPVGARGFELQMGACFDASADDMARYLKHYAPLDPFVRNAPGPFQLNQTFRLSDVVTSAELGKREFSDFMRQVPYHHATGTLTAFARQPVAVIGLHCHRYERDFSSEEVEIMNRLAPHVGRAIYFGDLLNDVERRHETGLLVYAADGVLAYISPVAQRIINIPPPPAFLNCLAPSGPGMINLGKASYRVTKWPLSAASLLQHFATEFSGKHAPGKGMR